MWYVNTGEYYFVIKRKIGSCFNIYDALKQYPEQKKTDVKDIHFKNFTELMHRDRGETG